jgi:hypothetical protein
MVGFGFRNQIEPFSRMGFRLFLAMCFYARFRQPKTSVRLVSPHWVSQRICGTYQLSIFFLVPAPSDAILRFTVKKQIPINKLTLVVETPHEVWG